MLIDPENPCEEWTEQVRANSLPEAQARCEYIAETSGTPTEVINVSQLTKTARNGTFKFVCWFKSEVIP